MFDRSLVGFIVGFILSFAGTVLSDVYGAYGPLSAYSSLSEMGFMYYMRLGCIFFSGSITFGHIGRQLSHVSESWLVSISGRLTLYTAQVAG